METKWTDAQADAMNVLVGIIGKEHAEALVDGSSTTLAWVCEDVQHEDGQRTKDALGKAGITALATLFPVSAWGDGRVVERVEASQLASTDCRQSPRSCGSGGARSTTRR